MAECVCAPYVSDAHDEVYHLANAIESHRHLFDPKAYDQIMKRMATISLMLEGCL